MPRKRSLVLFLTLLLGPNLYLFGASAPKNVIFMIGDGMGLAQISLTRIRKGSSLHLDSMKYTGLVTTCSADAMVTDSAASGTALATGYKTKNGMLATLPDGTVVPTILEKAIQLKKATGLITTVTITHATPASFGSHQRSRSNETEVAPQYLEKQIDLLMGGGKVFFIPKSTTRGKRADERDLLAEGRVNKDTGEKMQSKGA